MTIDPTSLASVEALLFLADEPIPVPALASALECDAEQVRVLLDELVQRLEERQSGLVVRHVAGGVRLYTSPVADDVVERHLLAGRSGRLSNAALETLAVVAWKQPISRGDVSDIRGVNADGAMRSLQARGLVTEVGRDDGPGQAVLFGTTTTFLEQLGLASLEDLPPLTDYLDEVAPDEPVGDGMRRARRALAAGGRLPSTLRGTWDGSVLDEDDDGADGDEVRSRSDDFRDLTEDLERVAQAAMDRLREAVAASEDPEAAMADALANGTGTNGTGTNGTGTNGSGTNGSGTNGSATDGSGTKGDDPADDGVGHDDGAGADRGD